MKIAKGINNRNVGITKADKLKPIDMSDPFKSSKPNPPAADPFSSNDPFSAAFSPAKPADSFSSDPFASFGAPAANAKNDPFDPFGDGGTDRSTSKTPVDMSGKDPFGCDPFASLQPASSGPPPRPESPSPALPPKKSKQPPPRPAPPRPVQQPAMPATTQNDPFGSSSGTFADFANFDSKFSEATAMQQQQHRYAGLEFTEDPFRNYRYEDPFNISDPFDDEKDSKPTSASGAKLDPFGLETDSGFATHTEIPPEDQQLAWAAAESLRLEEERRKRLEQEQADLEYALALSREEKKSRKNLHYILVGFGQVKSITPTVFETAVSWKHESYE
ncbi:hypothetical protein L9F63_002793, partial [Diploptera punctata]